MASSGNGKQLSLTLTEVATITAKHRLIAAGKTADEIVGTYLSGRLDTLFVSGVEFSIADIVQDSAAEEVRLLQYDAHSLAQRLLGDIRNRNTVIEDASTLYLVETVDEVS